MRFSITLEFKRSYTCFIIVRKYYQILLCSSYSSGFYVCFMQGISRYLAMVLLLGEDYI